MPLQFVTSQRGKQHLVVDGYRFIMDKISSGKNIWKCVDARESNCPARCHTANGEVLMHSLNHNHVPDASRIEAQNVMKAIRDRARTTTEGTQQIISEEIIGMSTAATAVLPSISNVKRTIQRVRQAENNFLPNPCSLAEIVIPESYTKTLRGEDFLLRNIGPENTRILLFSTRKNLDFLSQCPEWFADGTFKTSPEPFQQLYTIHAVKFKKVFPMLFALLGDKSEETYERLFTALDELKPNLNPISIMTDFEKSSINAFRVTFPNAVQNGCFFHFSQCLWRQIQRIPEALNRYTMNPDYALNLRMLAALAFVPVADIINSFEALQGFIFFNEHNELQPLLDYFEDVWIGRPLRRGTRRPPQYQLRLWNCYEGVLQDKAKTNNSVEGWHRAFSSSLGHYHPSIWKLIDGLKKEQNLNEVKMEQYLSGHEPPRPRRIYREAAVRLKVVVATYGQRTLEEYLRGIAHNINYNV